MEITFFTGQLADNARRIEELVRGVNPEAARWKPEPASWSMLEVINHLYDEERADFRVRLDIILHDPQRPWPRIDPQGWVQARNYNERDLAESLANFLTEREKSLGWLGNLQDPDWDAVCETPFGSMRAGDMFVSWVTHDHLHMRQLVELHRALTIRAAGQYRLEYAGEW